MLASTLNSRRILSTRMSRCSSPIPEMIVCPVSSSVLTRKDGSSCASLPSAMPIFSWSGFDLGSTATDITGSGNSIRSSTIGLSVSQSVSPVVTSFRPTAAAISPASTSLISSRLLACIWTIRPTRSFFSFTELKTPVPLSSLPEYTRKNVSVPTNGSVAILKASAANGALSSASRVARVRSLSSNSPSIARTSVGDGRYSITASSTACTPLFLNALPPSTGTNSLANVRIRIPRLISASVSSVPSRYLSIYSSVASAALSMRNSRISATCSAMSAGTSWYSKVIPWSSWFQMMHLFLTRSTTPLKSSSEPIVICNGTALAFSRSLNCFTTLMKSAPARSILFTNTMRGTSYLLSWRHTVSVCGCTPEEPQSTTTAPSSTRSERSTSMVKSTCPGVSILFTRCSSNWASMPLQKQVVAAEVIVIPRSCSCSIQSIVAAPSCTSPMRCDRPV